MPANLQKTSDATVDVPTSAIDLQDNLRRLDRLANLGLVAASAAHEIKNGLVAINTYFELVAQKDAEPEMAQMVRRELHRINGLVTQMLRFAAAKPAAFASVSVHELLEHSLRLLEHQLSGQLIGLTKNFSAMTDSIRADESQLQQAFMNLLLNAVEAIGSNGELAITTQNATDQHGCPRLIISIRDSGPGVTAENLPHLFEPFFTTKKNGTGLGLPICRRAVEEHRGTIEVQSELGKGTTFLISLPLK